MTVNGCQIVRNAEVYGLDESIRAAKFPMAVEVSGLSSELTPGITSLAKTPIGEGHDNFLLGIVVQFDLTFTVKAWTELQRYHFIDIISSQSTMHRAFFRGGGFHLFTVLSCIDFFSFRDTISQDSISIWDISNMLILASWRS